VADLGLRPALVPIAGGHSDVDFWYYRLCPGYILLDFLVIQFRVLAMGSPPGVNGGVYLLRINLESTGVLHSGYSRNILGFYTPGILGVCIALPAG